MPHAMASTERRRLAHLLAADRADLIAALEVGIETTVFEEGAVALGLTEGQLADLLRITPSTLARRKRAGRLTFDESERLYRIVRLAQRAAEVLGGVDAARVWLQAPKLGLGGATPLTHARTEPGARDVEDLLGRIEYGIPS